MGMMVQNKDKFDFFKQFAVYTMFENTFQARLLDVGNISKSPSMLISKPVFKIGRHPASDFVIEQKTISGRHAVIEQKQNGYFIVDQNSTNKTRVNGTVLDPNIPKQINDGDEIQFDKFSFIFKLEKIEPPPSGPAQDDDETIFFDSSSLIDDIKNLEPSQPAEDNEGTIFLDSGSLADEVEEAGLRKKPADTIEKTKIGNYEVIKLLGKGGFGSVWEARTKDGQPIAIKVLNPDVLENERAVRKFFHEAIILSRLDHPNICRFIDFFPYEENYAIVMDFVQGTELKTILENQKGPLPFDTALRIASQTLDAFHYAHMQNVLHRDIKPENITLDTEGMVKVMDFGIAKLSSSESQQTSLFMISPAYTAPERFDAEKTEMVDHRSDIYSLGLVFYEIFTGTHPFPTTNPVEMIVAHINKVPSPPDEITDLPPEISAAILKALEKNPKDRFEDFAAFKISLLGEPPRMPDGRSQSAVSFYGEYCKGVAVLLKMYADILKKYEKKVDKISMVQEGTQVHLIIEPRGGNPMRITKDLATIIKQ